MCTFRGIWICVITRSGDVRIHLARLWKDFRCGDNATIHSKTTTAAPKDVSLDGAVMSVISEVGSISSLKDEQLKAFLNGKDRQ